MTAWRITRAGNSVDLPVNPERVTDRAPPNIQEIGVPGSVYIFAYGPKARVVTATGIAYVRGQNADDLWTNYLSSLYGWRGRVVTISNAGAQYNGEAVLLECNLERRKGAVSPQWYSIQLGYGTVMEDI